MEFVISSIKPAKGKRGQLAVKFDPPRDELLVAKGFAEETARLVEGSVLTEGELAELVTAEELFRCRQRAWALLAHRPRSKRELQLGLLQRKFPQESVDKIIAHLEEKGYLNDGVFARMVVEQAAHSGKSGPRLVRQKLAQKGVTGDTAGEALQPLEDSATQEHSARRLMDKWNQRKNPTDPHKRRQAAAGYLMRRGFDPDIVWEVVRSVVCDDEVED